MLYSAEYHTQTDNYMGGNIGIGFFSNMTETIVRFDAGLAFQNYQYDVISIVDQRIKDWRGGETSSRFINHQTGEESGTSPFFTLTFNSNNDSAMINYFVNAGYFVQQLLDYGSGASNSKDSLNYTITTIDRRPDCSAGFLFINPGISLSLTSNIRLLLGVKILKEAILQLDSGSAIIVPNLQFDFRL